jgi:hypothetical protein
MKNVNNNGLNINFDNRRSPVKCIKTTLIHASPQEVWNVLVNVNLWATWQFDISKSMINGKLQKNTSIIWEAEDVEFRSVIHTLEPYRKIGWSCKMLGMRLDHNWYLSEVNGITQVTTRQNIDGFLAKLFRKTISMSIEYDILRWLEFLKMECEKSKYPQYYIPKLFYEFESN